MGRTVRAISGDASINGVECCTQNLFRNNLRHFDPKIETIRNYGCRCSNHCGSNFFRLKSPVHGTLHFADSRSLYPYLGRQRGYKSASLGLMAGFQGRN